MGGLEAMELQRAKGESVYELQQREKQDQARRKEEQEIKDIEAMFQALEIAERRGGNSSKNTKGKRNGRDAQTEQRSKTSSVDNVDGNDESAGERRGRGRAGGRQNHYGKDSWAKAKDQWHDNRGWSSWYGSSGGWSDSNYAGSSKWQPKAADVQD